MREGQKQAQTPEKARLPALVVDGRTVRLRFCGDERLEARLLAYFAARRHG